VGTVVCSRARLSDVQERSPVKSRPSVIVPFQFCRDVWHCPADRRLRLRHRSRSETSPGAERRDSLSFQSVQSVRVLSWWSPLPNRSAAAIAVARSVATAVLFWVKLSLRSSSFCYRLPPLLVTLPWPPPFHRAPRLVRRDGVLFSLRAVLY